MPGVELGSAHVEIRATQDKLKKDLDDAHQSISGKLGGAMAAAATTMAVAGVAAGAAIVAVGVSSIQAASDVNESLSKVGVVFGENAGEIEAWAATAATSMGQSRGEALAAAGTLGNLFVAMGLGTKDAAGLSTEMVELASDLGSFNNIASSDALEKLRAGLIGEAEPLRALGVNMNAAMVEAKGMELGLETVNGELTEAAKVQARYAIIMEQTKTAQGDFSRTSTGMANATKIIQASFADLQVQIGDQLLPVIAPLISSFAQWLPTAIEASKPILSEVGRVVGEVAGFLGETLGAVGKFASGWEDSTADVRGATSALWETIGPIFQQIARNIERLWAEVFPELQAAWEAVSGRVQAKVAIFAAFWNEHWETISKVLSVVMAVIGALIDVTFSAIKTVILVVLNAIQGDWKGAWDAVKAHFVTVWAAIQTAAGTILPLLQEMLGSAAARVGEAAARIGTAIVDGIKNALSGAWNGLVQRLTELVEQLPAAARMALDIGSPSKVFAEIGEQIVDGLAAGLGAAAPEAFGPIEKALAAFREKEGDEQRRHGRQMAELETALGSAKEKERERVLRAIEDEEAKHAQRVEDLTRDHGEAVVRAERDVARQRRAAIEDLRDSLVTLETELGERTDALNRQIEEVRGKAAGSIASLGVRRDESRAMRSRRDVFDDATDLTERQFRAERSDAERQYAWERDKEKAQLKHAEDLAKEEVRLEGALRGAANRGSLAEEEAFLREEHRIRREALDTEKTARIQAADAAWEEAKKETARRRVLEEEERVFRKEQERLRRQFEDALADEALEKERTRLLSERDARITSLEDQRGDLAQSYEDKIADLKSQFLDKVGPLTEEEMAAIVVFLDTITTKAHDAAAAITNAASSNWSAGGASFAQQQWATETYPGLEASLPGTTGGTTTVIELDGVAVGKAVAPYIHPEAAHFAGSRIGGV